MQMNAITYRQQVFGLLVNDTVEYSKKNAAIDPILQSFIGKPAAAAAAKTPSK
jgi:hypothetical protein